MPCTAVLEVRPLGALLGFINHLLWVSKHVLTCYLFQHILSQGGMPGRCTANGQPVTKKSTCGSLVHTQGALHWSRMNMCCDDDTRCIWDQDKDCSGTLSAQIFIFWGGIFCHHRRPKGQGKKQRRSRQMESAKAHWEALDGTPCV